MSDQSISRVVKRAGGAAVAGLIRAGVRSLDIRFASYDWPGLALADEFDEPAIYLCWHEYILATAAIGAHCRLTMLVSRHRDADWLTHAARHLGFHTVRGSTRRGGSVAVRRLQRLSRGHSFAITPDGPLGPRRQMAAGAIYLASLLEMPLVPIGVGYQRPWRMPTWDRFAIPRPGARTRLITGPRLRIGVLRSRAHLDQLRQQVNSLLDRLTSLAELWANRRFELTGHRRAVIQARKPTRLVSGFPAVETSVHPRPHRVECLTQLGDVLPERKAAARESPATSRTRPAA